MHLFRSLIVIVILLVGTVWPAQGVTKDSTSRYASIVVDANTQNILHARRIDVERFPASLTKLMTLYLTFDAIERGELGLKDKLKVSSMASRQPPSRLGLKTGQTITVEQAIQALAVKSANDVAVVLAERLGGGEDTFARKMTYKARALGMSRTTFKNASGLPHDEQVTTARDLVKLAEALRRDFPQYYKYFGQKTFTWKGNRYRNHNNLLHWVKGVDGLKTGYTIASGYNLAITAERDGKRIIAVVMGGASGAIRDRHMKDLIDKAFEALDEIEAGQVQTVSLDPQVDRAFSNAAYQTAQAPALRGSDFEQGSSETNLPPALPEAAWSVQVGAYADHFNAKTRLDGLKAMGLTGLDSAEPRIVAAQANGRTVYRARFIGLEQTDALTLCAQLRTTGPGCFVMAPNQAN